MTGAQGYDKKTIDKMLGDGAKNWPRPNPAEREQGIGFFLGYMTCAYKAQYQPLVVKALKDPSPKVRAFALQTLEKVAAKDAIPEIALLLEDPVKDVQERAAYALGTIGDPSAVPYLTKVRDNVRGAEKDDDGRHDAGRPRRNLRQVADRTHEVSVGTMVLRDNPRCESLFSPSCFSHSLPPLNPRAAT